GPAAQSAKAFGDPGRALLLHRLDPDDLDAVLIVEGEVLGAVERPANADLDHPSGIDQAFLDAAAEGRTVEELAAEVFVPRVGMSVEVHDAERPVAARDGSENGQRHRMIAAHAERYRAGGDDLAHLGRDPFKTALDGDGHDVDVTAVGHAETLEGVNLEHRIPGADQRGLLAHRPRAEARPRPVGRAAIVRDADQRHVEAGG